MKLKPSENKAPKSKWRSVLDRAKRRLAAINKQPAPPPPQSAPPLTPPGELFMEEAECARTGQPYVLIWHRASENERFTIHEVVKTVSSPDTCYDPPNFRKTVTIYSR